MTRLQKITRPTSIWPEVWAAMSKKQRHEDIEFWNEKRGKIDAARERRGLSPENADDPTGLVTFVTHDTAATAVVCIINTMQYAGS